MNLKGSDNAPEPDAAISREIELKLRATPDAVAQILASPLLAAGIPGLASAQNLDAAYYDTADLRLQKRGISLRVRREGDRFVQNIKTKGTATGALDRREWETVVPDLTPRPDWVTDRHALALLGHLAPNELSAICRTLIERETRVIGYKHDGDIAIIEIAFDRGTLEAGERTVPTAEIELELLKGHKQALYALAQDLHEVAPLQIELRSKAERAYALFTGDTPKRHKARKVRFTPDTSVADGISAVFDSCFTHWTANEPAVLESGDAEALHQMRVALRRTRSALTLFDSVLPVMQARWLKRECQWIGNALGAARNWDVFLDDVLAPLEAKRQGDLSLTALRQQCLRARARNYETAREAIQSPRYTTFVLNFSRWLDDAGWRSDRHTTRREILDAPLTAFAQIQLERRHRKLLKQGRKLAAATPETRHRLRIAVKKMRYASEFFAALYPGKASGKMIKDLSRLQITLGDLNDLAVTERQLETVIYQAFADPAHDDIVRGVGLVVGWSTARAKRGETNLLAQWDRFTQRKRFWKRTKKR